MFSASPSKSSQPKALTVAAAAALLGGSLVASAAQAAEYATVVSSTPVMGSVPQARQVCSQGQQIVQQQPSGAGAVIGAIFDGNIHSLGGAFGFDPALNRSVAVSTLAVEEALTKIYPAPRLIKELHGG